MKCPVRRGAADAIDVAVTDRVDFQHLEAVWRELETRANPSFFQSWTWMGCLATERFPNPVLVEARQGGRVVALALFNRRGRTLYLGASGIPALDCIYVEFNGVLAEAGREAALSRACLRAARGGGVFGRRLVLDGVDDIARAAAEEPGQACAVRSQASPFVCISGQERDFLARRGANTRYQIRRSDRYYAGDGAIVLTRAETLPQALEQLDRLAVPHQASWSARGRQGAFDQPFFRRFHRALLESAIPRGEADLWCASAGGRPIGYLYNFRYRGRVLAYQSGFEYGDAGPHGKPGLTCHHRAIVEAAETGMNRYDFLAGDGRYKVNLADEAETLHWIEVDSRYAPRPVARWLRDRVRRWVEARGLTGRSGIG